MVGGWVTEGCYTQRVLFYIKKYIHPVYFFLRVPLKLQELEKTANHKQDSEFSEKRPSLKVDVGWQ